MSLTTLAWRSLAARPARVALSVARGRARRRRPVRGVATNAGVEASVHRRSASWSVVPTCAWRPSVRPACRPTTVATIAGTPGVAVVRRPSSGGPTSGRSWPPARRFRRRSRSSASTRPPMPRLHDLAIVAARPSPGRRREASSSPSASPPRTGWSGRIADAHRCRVPRDRRRPTVIGIVAGDGPLTGPSGAGRSSCRPAPPRRSSGRPASAASTVAIAPGRRTPWPHVGARDAADRASRTCSPAGRPRRGAAGFDRRLPGDDRALAAVALFVGRVPHLQHAVDVRDGADPRSRPAPRRGRHVAARSCRSSSPRRSRSGSPAR